MQQPLALGIIGAGSIGTRVAQAVAHGEIGYTLAGVYDMDSAAAERLSCACGCPVLAGAAELAAACDVLVEAASGKAVPGIIQQARDSHAGGGRPGHVLVMSVGGLLGVPVFEDEGPVIHIPSGAIGGLDAIQALGIAGLDEVRITTSKPPAALGLEVTEYTVIFEGPACEVIEQFPKNVNVAIALSFAGLGPHKTTVRLVADPAESRNVHHIVARGPAGEVEFISRNQPFPDNPRTSYLAALSAVALLKRLAAHLQVG
jgi:aspartate dehydrogenase